MAGQVAHTPLRVRRVTGLPVSQMLIGKGAEEAAELLPRLFNLCRTAQSLAARAAFGLPLGDQWQDDLRAEIQREHVMKLCLRWPAALNIAAVPLQGGWQSGDLTDQQAILGARGRLPETPDTLSGFLAGNSGIAPVLRAVSQVFGPSVADRKALPLSTADTMFEPLTQENSVAARHATHPVMQHVQAQWGRGPFWSALGVAYDLQAEWQGWLPQAHLAQGYAVVPAARGLYAVRARIEDGKVAAFARRTPTDHLLAKGGALDQSLTSLPMRNRDAVASVLLSILDPCHPVKVEPAAVGEGSDREVAHA